MLPMSDYSSRFTGFYSKIEPIEHRMLLSLRVAKRDILEANFPI